MSGGRGKGRRASGKIPEVRRKLLGWYRRNARDLPWRRDRDPYRIWVSEVMLQQTRVEAVQDHYRRFLERFPTVSDLSSAGRDEVLACWSGLGYYHRARNMHRAARVVVERHAGSFPADLRAARALPGVGPYTAGAVLSMAYGARVPAVDGNARRVVCRVFGVEGDPTRPPAGRRVAALAGALAEGPDPGAWNQALMELGATVCAVRSPSCEACPLAGGACVAEASGRQRELARGPSRRAAVTERLAAAAVRHAGSVLLLRDETGGIVRGLWEPPWTGLPDGDEDPDAALREALRERHGIRVDGLERAGEIRHAVLHRRLHVIAYAGRARRRHGPRRGGGWFPERELDSLPLSALARKILAATRQDSPARAPSISSRSRSRRSRR